MPRQLPWLKNSTERGKGSTVPSDKQAGSARPPKRRRTASSPKLRNGNQLSPSSSPPQAPLETLMKPSDDAWVMVEDEFYSTAQLFTRHLHQAEYNRQKALSTRSLLETPSDIKRPVIGVSLSNNTKQKQRNEARRDNGSRTFKAISTRTDIEHEDTTDSQGEEEDMLFRDKNLASLMLGKPLGNAYKTPLHGLIGQPKSNTRAAAGFGKQDMQGSYHGTLNSHKQKTYNDGKIFADNVYASEVQPEIDKRATGVRPQTGQANSSWNPIDDMLFDSWLPSPTRQPHQRNKGAPPEEELKDLHYVDRRHQLGSPTLPYKKSSGAKNQKEIVQLDEIPTFLF